MATFKYILLVAISLQVGSPFPSDPGEAFKDDYGSFEVDESAEEESIENNIGELEEYLQRGGNWVRKINLINIC